MQRNVTQQALGYKIGKKSRGDIQAWESGRHLPKERETVLALARALHALSPLTHSEIDHLLLAAHHVPEYQTAWSLARASAGTLVIREPFMVENLPADYVPRPHEFDGLIDMLLGGRREGFVAITAALRGAGGYGKTTMAKAICQDPRIRETFSGVLWVTLGENPGNLVGKIEDLIYALSKERPGFTSIDAAAAHLAMLLADRTILIVVDDVWNPAHLHPFLQGGGQCSRLITTRDDGALPSKTKRIQVDAMRPDEAFQVLVSGLSDAPRSLRDTQSLRTLVQKLGEWPLLLKLVNAALRERVWEYRQPLSEALVYVNTALKRRGLTAFDHNNPQQRDQAVMATLSVSFELLGADSSRYRELALFPEDANIPLRTVQKLWSATGGRELDEFDVDTICGRLRRLSLLLGFDPVKRSIRLHDVIRAYLQRELGEPAVVALHGQFLDAYRTRGWAELPESEPYLWGYLAYHLVSAARGGDLVTTVQDLYYLAKKISVRDTYAVVLDLLSAETQASGVASLRLLKYNVTNMSHLLNACQTFDEVAVTLHSRLAHLDELAEQCRALRERLSRPYLIPWHALPSLPNPALIRTLRGHTRFVHGCAISPDGEWVVSASWDNTLKVWDARTGAELLTLEGHTDAIHGCAVSPLGDYLVSASGDGTLKVWDAQIGTELLTLRGHTGAVYGCAVSPAGDWVASASRDGTLRVWDTQTGAVRLILRGHGDAVRGCAVGPSGDWIVSASQDGTLKIWEARTGAEQLTLVGHGGSVFACAVSPDGKRIVSASWDRTLKIWDRHLGIERLTLAGHTEIVFGCAVSPAGDYIVSAGQDETLKIWDMQTGGEMLSLEGHSGPVYACAVSPAGDWIVSASDDKTLSVWDARTGEELGRLEGHTERVGACAVSPAGDFIVSASDDKTLRVWDRETGYFWLELRGHEDVVNGCAVSPVGDYIVSASGDMTLKIWDAPSGTERLTLTGHTGWVNGCAVSPAGDYIVSASGDQTLKIWNVQTGSESRTLQGHGDAVRGCAVSPTGDRIVSVGENGTLKVWDASDGRCLTTLMTEGSLRTCTFCPDGVHLIAGGYSGLYFLQLVL